MPCDFANRGFFQPAAMLLSRHTLLSQALLTDCLMQSVNIGLRRALPGGNLLRGFVHGDIGGAVYPARAFGASPAHGVLDDELDVRIIIRGIGFVAGAEVEDLAGAATPRGTAAEDFAACKPGDKDLLVRRGDAEGL